MLPQPFPARADLLSAEQEAFLVTMAKESVPPEEIQALGQTLYQALFVAPNLAQDFFRAQGIAEAKQGKLRLRLAFEPSEPASLPWEAMHDGQEWLIRRNITLVRRIRQEPAARQITTARVFNFSKLNFQDSAS